MAGGVPVTSGSVTFEEGSTILASAVPLDSNGHASFSISTLSTAAIPHTITAVYSGSVQYATSSGSTSQTVNKRTLTITAAATGKIYDGTTTATVTLSDDRVSGDNLTESYMSATFADKNVGTSKLVTVTGITISGPAAGNYTYSANASTTASITPLTLTVSATAADKVYDGTTTASVTLSDNRISGDVFAAGDTSATFADVNAGNSKAVSVIGISISGNDAGNYTLAATTATASASITPRPITVTANAESEVYGQSDPALTYQITAGSLVNGDVFSGAFNRATGDNVGTYAITQGTLALSSNYAIAYAAANLTITPAPLMASATAATKVYGAADPSFSVGYSGFVLGQDASVLGGALAFTTAATASSDVGVYPVTPSGLSSNNYAITYAAANLTITPAPLMVSATAETKVYGAADPSFSVDYSGFVLGQDPSVLGGGLAFTTAATASSNVGAYSVTPGGFTSSNYAIAYAAANLTITPAPLTVSATAETKVYGQDNPLFSVDYSGFVLGQDPSVLGGGLAFTTAATASSDVGGYPVTPGGFTSNNYAIAYAAANLTITPAPLTVSATAETKVYGQDNPLFSVDYSGFVLGQDPSVLGGGLAFTTAATASSDVGGYPVTPGGFTSNNYAIAYAAANLTITPAPLTVSATAETKVYGQDNPSFSVDYSGFVLGQNSSVLGGGLAFTTAATASSDVGGYPVTPGGFTSNNYAIAYAAANLTITPAPLTVSAVASTKVYGQDNPRSPSPTPASC